jgi:activator of 2-hydroxyglutaryl-CoA dehydratase
MSYAIGLDIGSTYTKGLILDDGGRVVGRAMRQSGGRLREAATAVMQDAIAAAGLTRAAPSSTWADRR